MTFVFWQGIISIHQKSFLEAVAIQPGVGKVILVVERDMTEYRRSMGWSVPELTGVDVIIAPSQQDITRIVNEYKDAIHIMGGIRIGATITMAFDACVQQGCKLGVMTESYDDTGIKGALRKIRYQYLRLRHLKHIQFVLAIGEKSVQQYLALGYDSSRLFPWAYFITIPTGPRVPGPEHVQRIIYAGRLEEGKGIYYFAKQLLRTGSDKYILNIYGTGPDEERIKQLEGASGRINIHPFLPHDKLIEHYAAHDWAVLPSAAKDGWGVIVSEGLLNGLKVICSDICGASRVISNGRNGTVFNWNKEGSCEGAINRLLQHSFASPDAIKQWAEKGISAEAGATYLMHILACVYNKNEQRPELPWEATAI